MVREALGFLAPERGGLFVDCTVGLGGHAQALLEANERTRLVGIDRDPQALARARIRLEGFGARTQLVRGRFSEVSTALSEIKVAGVIADLGVSSLQLDSADRGFSFQRDAPLDMRMGGEGRSALALVNEDSEADLERIFREFGEERRARSIARAVVRARETTPVETTAQLRAIVARAKGPRRRGQRTDPATQVFQALRIAVNEELSELGKLMERVVDLLDEDGRLVVISYHSLEDRIVKNELRDLARGAVDPVTGRTQAESRLIELLTKKPQRPSSEEVAANPRARSARLRAARRL